MEGWLTLRRSIADPAKESDLISQFRAAGKSLVPSPKPGGFQLDWLCPQCFETCREELEFVVDPEHPQWSEVGL
jgi:hypothetical protein